MTNAISTVRTPPTSHIATTIASYLGNEDGDLIFKRQIFHRLFTQATTFNLDWHRRPEKLQEKIDSKFERLTKNDTSMWHCSGSSSYHLCNINECLLLKAIILKAPITQKEFYFLDIGAGNFQLGETIEDFINKQNDLPPDITVYIISMRGEAYFGEPIIISKRCKHYKLGCFKIEEITKELEERRGLKVKNKIDVATSRLCMTHVCDPLALFAQIHDDLLSGSGILCMDQFDYFVDGDEFDSHNQGYSRASSLMFKILLDSKSPFLAHHVDGDFILKKLDCNRSLLPLRYLPLDEPRRAKYKRNPDEEISWSILLPQLEDISDTLHGSKSLFNSLKTQGVIEPSRKWMPIEIIY